MISAFFAGIIPGLILSLAIGPVFFMLIKTSLQLGFEMSLYLILGIFISDLCCILLVYFGLDALLQSPSSKHYVLIAGGIILILFGLASALSKKKYNLSQTPDIKKGDKTKLMFKGFVFNITNPSVIFFWAAYVGVSLSQFNGESSNLAAYIAGTQLSVSSVDVLKAWSAGKIKPYMTDRSLMLVNRYAGIGIALFGLFIILKVWFPELT